LELLVDPLLRGGLIGRCLTGLPLTGKPQCRQQTDFHCEIELHVFPRCFHMFLLVGIHAA
jgi:hypothetical protein